VYLFVTVPTWLLLAWFIFTERFETHPAIGIVIIAAFAVEAALHNTLWLIAAAGGTK
jgi:hypothetical protein